MKLCIHSLQHMPPSCLNRDRDSHLKKIVSGGVERNRVSSQCWKRQVRLMMNDLLTSENVSYRTKHVYGKVADEMSKMVDADKEDLVDYVKVILEMTLQIEAKEEKGGEEKRGPVLSKILLYLSGQEIENLASLLADEYKNNSDPANASRDIAKKVYDALAEDLSCDIALFGRMIATKKQDLDLSVEGSCFFSDAYSTHAAYVEPDFFTTVDDLSMEVEDKNIGAGFLDNTEIASSTFYRYAGIDINGLKKNMGDKAEMIQEIVDCFIKAFLKSSPMGKSHAYGQFTLPTMTVITLSTDCPYNFSPAFEKPILADYDGGYMENSIKAMDQYVGDLIRVYDLENKFIGHIGVQKVENFGKEYSLNQILEEIHKHI